MRINIHNRQTFRRIQPAPLKALVRRLLNRAELTDASRALLELDVHLTDDLGITADNLRVFGRGYPTDVISLTYTPPPGQNGFHGEVLVNVERACVEAVRRGGRPDTELALYLAHGIDHLAGERDDSPVRRARMLRRERRWLREILATEPALFNLIAPPRARSIRER
jgi:probable rRNA maturation factor